MAHPQRETDMGDLVPFPSPKPAEPITPAEILPAGQPWRFVHRLPARLQDPGEVRRIGEVAARGAIRTPIAYPSAVGRGMAITCRAWWQWVTVADFYQAAKATNQLAARFDDVQRYRVRRRLSTLATLASAGVGLLLGADGETDLDAGEAVTVKTHLLEIKGIRGACQRGRALREAAGTLTGDAAGNTDLGELPPEVAARIEQETARATTGDIVDAEIVEEFPELPEALGLLVDAIDDHEHGIRSTGELAARIGWDAKDLGEALRTAGVPRPRPARQRVPGSNGPVPVYDLDDIRATVVEQYGSGGTTI